MKLLVTGGTGYVGGRLSTLLASRHSIRMFCRKVPEALREWSSQFEVVTGDVLDAESLVAACAGVDAIVHCAALNETETERDASRAQEVNVHGTKNALEAARKNGVKKFIYLSTFHVYGKQTGVITEETVASPTTVYGQTHLDAEKMCGEYDEMQVVVLRISNVMGAPIAASVDRWTLLINSLCKQVVDTGKIVLRDPNGVRDYVALKDIASGVSLFLDSATAGTYNLGGDLVLSTFAVAEKVAGAYRGLKGKDIKVETEQARQDPAALDFNCDRLRKLGYVVRAKIDDEIRETLEVLQ